MFVYSICWICAATFSIDYDLHSSNNKVKLFLSGRSTTHSRVVSRAQCLYLFTCCSRSIGHWRRHRTCTRTSSRRPRSLPGGTSSRCRSTSRLKHANRRLYMVILGRITGFEKYIPSISMARTKNSVTTYNYLCAITLCRHNSVTVLINNKLRPRGLLVGTWNTNPRVARSSTDRSHVSVW